MEDRDPLDRPICKIDGVSWTSRDILMNQITVLLAIYVDYFVTYDAPTYEGLEKLCVSSVRKMIYAINDKYADHVEGLRRTAIEQRRKSA